VDMELGKDWAESVGHSRVLAARKKSGPGVHQAILRLERDVYCITVMREPAASEGLGWAELDQQWSDAVGSPFPGVIGSARLFLARLTDPATAPIPNPGLAAAVRTCPADARAGAWWERGIAVSNKFAVWEASEPVDDRTNRHIVVVAGEGHDAELSAWTWTSGDDAMPRLGQYLLAASTTRYQLQIWNRDGDNFRRLRERTDDTILGLVAVVAGRVHGRHLSQAELVSASTQLDSLQECEIGLAQLSTSLRDMRRTVEITLANMTAFSGNPNVGGLFADDRALAESFGTQLVDDATYLETTRERAREVSAVVDQLVQRGQQRRQERFNLGLTGIVGAILMILAAMQSLEFKPNLPGSVKAAVIGMLGVLALLVSLVVLRYAIPERRWPAALVAGGFSIFVASLTWLGVVIASEVRGVPTSIGAVLGWSVGGVVVGVAIALTVTLVRKALASSFTAS